MEKRSGYFGGANTARGFVNYFGTITKDVERLYILKGGSGCGKNSLMKRVAAEAEKRGETVERVYCASDPESLDGVILRERGVGVVDGTAPHELRPRLPGAMDNLVDLGEYWDSNALRKRLEEIRLLTRKKSECYSRAYGLLAAAGGLRNERRRITDGALLWGKLSAAAERYAQKLSTGGAFAPIIRPAYALCGHGVVKADADDGELWQVRDCHDVKGRFFAALIAAVRTKGGAVSVSPDPTDPARLSRFKCGDVTVGEEEGSRVINMERFVDKGELSAHKQRLKLLSKAEEGIRESAVCALAEARRCHLALEAIYTPTMDFDRVNERTKRLIGDILA